MIVIYITCKDKKEALKIASKLLEKKLIACANMFPITSVFRWKNKIKNASEFVLLVKSTNKNYKNINEEVLKLHSYEIPCILKIKTKANTSFDKWVKSEVK